MQLKLIVIGHELLNGKIKDLNGFYLAKQSFFHNLSLSSISIIGDDRELFKCELKLALEHNDIVITCGGLGPTPDDITKPMLADFFAAPLEFNQEALRIVKQNYQNRERVYPEKELTYQNIPSGFKALANPTGHAPGLAYQHNGKFIFALPGVPHEFESMFTKVVLPHIKLRSAEIFEHLTFKTYGLPESKIFQEYFPTLWEDLSKYGEVSSLPHSYGVDIGLKIKAGSKKELLRIEEKVMNIIHSTELVKNIWHIGDETLAEVIIQKAKDKNITFGFSESCTGGLNASRITDVSGSSAVFWGSIVSYANEVKERALNVKPQTLIEHGAVSKETALEMAIGAKNNLAVDIAISTTGIAGPGGGSTEKPVGTIGIGISSQFGNSSEMFQFKGNREILKKHFSDKALFALLFEINKY